jgi:MoxR-like ATPase
MSQDNLIEKAVEEGGSYEVIRKRLDSTVKKLSEKSNKLNDARLSEFGSLKQELITTLNIHSENNSIPVDMTQVNGLILIGYNVVIGLKNSIQIEDIFDFYKIENKNTDYHPIHVPITETFLNDKEFKKSFDYLFSYYKDAKLFQITKDKESLYIVFQISSKIEDLKIFKFDTDRQGNYSYVGEGSSITILEKFKNNFNDWVKTTRNNFITGKHPHVSINDKVFVETIGGDLTIKIENNTGTGKGIYSEAVDNKLQNLEDADISYIDSGENILLKIKPYQESNYRYFIYNLLTQGVVRCDGVGVSCVSLPADHGYIFSNGYYLKSGESKIFDITEEYHYLTHIKSPNGEDYLYVFFDPKDKKYVLYPYNLVTKSISNPIFTNGYSLHNDGSLYVIKAHQEAQRVHPVQLWKTSFLNEVEYVKVRKEVVQTFYNKIGNNELVRCISDIFTIINVCGKKDVNLNLYESIIKSSTKIIDDFHWLSKEEAFGIKEVLQNIIETSILVVQEFEKVLAIQKQAGETLAQTIEKQKNLITTARILNAKEVSKYIEILSSLKSHLGLLITIKEQRYMDVSAISLMQEDINKVKDSINEKIISLLQKKESFDLYLNEISDLSKKSTNLKKLFEIEKVEEDIEKIVQQITIVNDEINDITFKDATIVSMILDNVSNIFAKLNQLKATIKNLKKGLMSEEAKIEFTSQFNLLGQSVSSSLTVADTVEKCDEQMTKVLNKVESLETKFADFEEYSQKIITKRDEIKDIFENHKQQLINEKQKRIQGIVSNATLTLNSIRNRVSKITKIEDMNSYFASDTLVVKYQQFIETVKSLGDNTKADDLFSAFKNIKDQSLRQLRDTQDIFEDNGNIMKLGKHRFSVNKTPIDLSMVVKDNKHYLHITSTDFYEQISDTVLEELKDFYDHSVISESKDIYRSEYLAYQFLQDTLKNERNLSIEIVNKAIKDAKIYQLISDYSSTLYKEGYIKGIHDSDASIIFEKFFVAYQNAGLLKYSKKSRIIAALALSKHRTDFSSLKASYELGLQLKSKLNNDLKYNDSIEKTVAILKSIFGDSEVSYFEESAKFIIDSISMNQMDYLESVSSLYDVLCSGLSSIINQLNKETVQEVFEFVDIIKSYSEIEKDERFNLLAEEIVYFSLISGTKKALKIETIFKVEGIIGQHEKINNGSMTIDYEDLVRRGKYHQEVVLPSYEKVNEIKQKLISNSRNNYRINDFKAKPLSSFVRNKLITESYLQLIGDNLAKQMGTVGDKKRTDLMGMLLLISPPGYGKTTLVEYIAQKLGLVFMKINCPSLGHSVTSLDPAEAPDATSRKEIEKINLAFEMGNNVMLYLDDIQHTNPEFLQKFISLCDGSRQVDGVWNGQPKTYDFKGKKFSVVMAGNPYTESGEVFKIPDMLSNRADIYNLGDMLSGQREVFELSYIENSLTANSVLAPLANRNLSDLYKFIENAKGASNPLNEFEHTYSQAEASEIIDILKKMLEIQKVVLKVNQQYIASAATADKYRVEPPFKLQGSYRNMNKMSEKIVSAMNSSEVQSMILDHYLGEAQTLTQGTEENLLKLKEILGVLSQEDTTRLTDIRKDFMRNKSSGGDDLDGFGKIAYQLTLLNESLALSYSKESEIDIVNESFNRLQEEIKNLINPEKDKAIIDILKTLDLYILQRVKNKKDEQLIRTKKTP